MDHIIETPPIHEVIIDGVAHKTGTRYYEYPSKLPDDDIIETFAEDLRDIIPVKLQELMERQDELSQKRKTEYEALDSINPPIDEFSYYFWSLWFELQFGEYNVIERWLKYWLRLAEKVAINKEWIVLDQEHGLPENQVEAARDYPLEDIYEGRLRQIGSRFVGICPFHEENTPSFTIFTQDNSFYCFGCNKWGNAIDLYMHLHKTDFPTTVRALI